MGERRKTLNIWLKRTQDKGGVEGSRPRTQKNIRGQRQPFQGQTLSRARTQAQVLSKKKKKIVFKNFFQVFSKKKKNQTISKKQVFLQKTIYKILKIPKIVLFSSREQGNFRGLEASRPRTSKCVLKDSTSVNGMYQQN